MKKNFVFFCLSILMAFLGLSVQAQTADEIINKSFEVTGGVDNWKTVKSMKMTGNIFAQNMTLPMEMFTKSPDKNYMKLDIQGRSLIQAYDGKTAWMINPFMGSDKPQKMPEDQAKDMKERKMESELIDYASKGYSVSFEGEEEILGTLAYKIKLVKKDGKETFYYFDKENNVLIAQSAPIVEGEMKGKVVITSLSDYKEVGNIIMPFYMETSLEGNVMAKITYETVELNVEVSDDLFEFKGEEVSSTDVASEVKETTEKKAKEVVKKKKKDKKD